MVAKASLSYTVRPCLKKKKKNEEKTMKRKKGWVVVVHAFNPSTQMRER